MARYFDVHPASPQRGAIIQIAEIVHAGGVIACPPTVSGTSRAVQPLLRAPARERRHAYPLPPPLLQPRRSRPRDRSRDLAGGAAGLVVTGPQNGQRRQAGQDLVLPNVRVLRPPGNRAGSAGIAGPAPVGGLWRWTMRIPAAAWLPSDARPEPLRQRYRHHHNLAAALRLSGGCRWITKPWWPT